MIRVVLPAPLQAFAKAEAELHFDLPAPVTHRTILDAVEERYPVLKGTLRDQRDLERRPFIRFFACQEDLSHQPPDTALPGEVQSGQEPYLIIGAMAGG